MKALVGNFNQEKALVGAFSVIVKSSFEALVAGMVQRTTARTGDGVVALSRHQGFYQITSLTLDISRYRTVRSVDIVTISTQVDTSEKLLTAETFNT